MKRRMGVFILVLALLTGMTWIVSAWERTAPENPLEQPAESSLMLTAEGNALSVSSKVTSNLEEKKQESEKDKDKDNKKKQGKRKSSKSQGNGKQGKDRSGGKTDLVYFTTTIKDGETVTKKEYRFSIKHKIPALTPKETKLYINGDLSDQIKDARTDYKILLSEGENTVRVQVIYENSHGQKIAPYKNYTINADTRNLVISTSLKDGQKVESPFLNFRAKAEFGSEDVDLKVEQDGEELSQFDGQYETELKKGANHFKMSAQYDEKHKTEETYTIYCQPPEGMHIETDLEDQTIRAVTGDFSFQAQVAGGSSKTEFTVSVNNKIIEGKNGVYKTVLLAQGEKAYNTIRLRAQDGTETDAKTFKIKYIPKATPETEPMLTHINLKDGQSVKKKNPFTLELAAEDYKGGKIYYDGMEVYLNGKYQVVRDTKPYTTYKLNFTDGTNLVRILIRDDDGREKEYQYSVYYTKPDDNEKIGTVTVSVDAKVLGLGFLISGAEADLLAGDSLAHIIVRTLESKGYGCIYDGSLDSGFYLSGIKRSGIGQNCKIPEALKQEINAAGISWSGGDENNPNHHNDSLNELDFTNGSGWMILVDGSFLSESASEADLRDGAIVKVRYTLAHGRDIGGTYQGETFDHTY